MCFYACIFRKFEKLVYKYGWVMMSFVSCLDVFTFSEGFESLYTSIAKSYSVYIYIYIYV